MRIKTFLTCIITTTLSASGDAKADIQDCVSIIQCSEHGNATNCNVYLDIKTKMGKSINKPFPPSVQRCPGNVMESTAARKDSFVNIFPNYKGKGSENTALEALDYMTGDAIAPSCKGNQLPTLAKPNRRCDGSNLKQDIKAVEGMGMAAVKTMEGKNSNTAAKPKEMTRSELQKHKWLP